MGPKFQIVIDVDDFRDWSISINGKKIDRIKEFDIHLSDESRDPVTYTVTEYAVGNTDCVKKLNGEYSVFPQGDL